ncbi:MAG: amino acid transporter [Gemmatimonadetes bacterium 13_1_40CM_2_60_3]|nr:MAG: amino acid transporter [Gemmatimonadetes bacterium 13_1_40CM_2_60_3]
MTATPTPVQPQRVEFVRAISRLDATALVVGSMIGSGIFIVSGDIVREVHAPGLLLLVWIASVIVTLLGALTYGELAAMFPKAGGQYVYLREGISPLFGFLYGWTLFTVIQTATIAAVAIAFARFTAVLVPALSPTILIGGTWHGYNLGVSWQRLFAIASVIILTWINVRGVRTAAIIQTSLTAIKTAALAGLIVLGLAIGRNAAAIAANFGANFWPAGGLTFGLVPVIVAAMVGSLFSMDAWNNVGFASGELKQPEKDLPFAMATGVLLVVTLYVLANVAYLNVLPVDVIAQTSTEGRPPVGTAAMQQMFGQAGLTVMAIAIMISTFGCNNGLILSGARVYYAMARDNLFFAKAGELHPAYRTPALALIVQAVWTCLLALSGTYNDLLNYIIFAAVLFYMVTVVGLLILRVKRPDLPRPVKAPGYPWLPGLYVLATGFICVDLLIKKPVYTWPGLIIVALGVPVYYLWRRFAKPA